MCHFLFTQSYWNAPESVTVLAFLAEEFLRINGFEAKLLSPSFPNEKRGTLELFPIICQSALCILDSPTQQTLGRFTPNQVHWDQGSEVVHWPKDRVSHLADTVFKQTSGCFTPNQVIGHFAHPVHLRLPMSQRTGAVDNTLTLQPLVGSLQMKFIFICAFHHLVKAIKST